MDIEDLRKFLAVAQHSNMQLAATELHVTPGALSKVIGRLEQRLQCQLFNRVGRRIVLNTHGQKFKAYAQHIVHETDQAVSEFIGSGRCTQIKLSGPSILLQQFMPNLMEATYQQNYQFNIDAVWEGEAIEQVVNGQSHFAFVTSAGLDNYSVQTDLATVIMGTTEFKVIAAADHEVFRQFPEGDITTSTLANFSFVCPTVSPFCGVTRGVGSDGWRDDKVPRDIKYKCSDFSMLLSLVALKQAFAYVPDWLEADQRFRVVNIVDCDYQCSEQIAMLYKPSLASGWLNNLVEKIAV